MFFITNHVKMATNRRCASDTQNEEESESFIEQVSRAVRSNRVQRQPIVDVIVASIAIPLLIIFSLMLQNSMRKDWIHDFDTRWRILGLGLSLLLISLIVCLYVTHRLGFCIWAVQQQREINRMAEHRRRLPLRNNLPAPLTSAGSQLHLMVNGELPPSYDSVMRNPDLPPPYFSVLICDEKVNQNRYQTSKVPRNVNIPEVHQTPTG
ncbi:UNVERIFIED_CONTAM: hypothetical protein PYX00_007766 [Menopon gallinae]|uniref:Uncharacterized protein n=1 Tax=Menopon gallinae TaxID=328185 RepID=A0AAW2HKF1_9NEOP